MSERVGSRPVLRGPLLFFKVGLLGSAPLEFGQSLADTWGLARPSTQQINARIRERREVNSSTREVTQQDMAKQLGREIAPLLQGGGNVMADVFFNTPVSRARTPIRLARDAGALLIALDIETPVSVIRQRVKAWTEEDRLGSLANVPSPTDVVFASLDILQSPTRKEDIDYIFHLDGTAEMPELLGCIEAGLQANYLIED